ncbi:hypothetical protein F4818DRAFT_210512 [Hypoxylon cercidicola]|nr:hypothetical protein F4818DRAFT_210512 [Hypoxylon cercidicola]
MAYRVSQSQADLASAYVSELDTAILNRPNLNEPFAPSPTISFTLSGSGQRQYTNENQLPSLPALFNVPSLGFGPFSQVNNFQPRHQHHVPSPPATNYDQNQDRPSWAHTRLEPAFPSLDSAPRAQEPHSSIAPPRTQRPRPSSLTTHGQLPQPNRSAPDTPSDDYYLATLADNNFSSPSLPPINSSPLPPSRPHSSNVPKPLEVGERIPMPRLGRQRTSKAGLVDLTKEEPDLDSTFGIDPRAPTMPQKRTATYGNGETGAAASKRRRTSQSSPSSSNKTNKARRTGNSTAGEATSLFTDDESASDPADQDCHEAIDLSNASDVPQELMAPKVDKRVKIGTFQCVICMDNCASLTVTHCGHLFCSECLHSALHIDSTKKTCPVCRTKVDLKDKKDAA